MSVWQVRFQRLGTTFLGVVFAFFYSRYLILFPSYSDLPRLPHLLVFWLLYALQLIAFWRTITTDPGQLPRPQTHPDLKFKDGRWIPPQARLLETKASTGGIRFCRTCQLVKPDRSHHCSTCNRCCLRMDHCCGFFGVCIGQHQHKFFLLYLLYTALASSFAAWSLFHIHSYQLKLSSLFFHGREGIGFMFIVSVSLATCLWAFFLWNFILAAFNFTAVELYEKRGFMFNVNQEYVNVYNVGILDNLRSVLGPKPYLWLLPVTTLPPTSGITFANNLRLKGRNHRKVK